MAAIKLRVTEHTPGRYCMALTCDAHDDFRWTFDTPSCEPDEWETALMVAYGHHAWAHGKQQQAPRVDVCWTCGR